MSLSSGAGGGPPSDGHLRLGAYVCAADPTWIRSTVARYYDHLDVLVVTASSSGTGWTGAPVAVDECLAALREIDHRGILRVVLGEWVDGRLPLAADTAQRQAAVDALGEDVDWILQLDTDELLLEPRALVSAIRAADAAGIEAVAWPMLVLYRRSGRDRYLEVSSETRGPRYEYPGPVAVRAGTKLREARHTSGSLLRVLVRGDQSSPQVVKAPDQGEARTYVIEPDEVIVHNSWARSPRSVRSKVRSWGHGGSKRIIAYYWLVWWLSPITWRILRNFHPEYPDFWPRLRRHRATWTALVDARERQP